MFRQYLGYRRHFQNCNRISKIFDILWALAAYKKKALLHHPDKAGESGTEKFKAIQEAFDVLADPTKRREFDSTDDFDDTLPVDCAPQDFFKVRHTSHTLSEQDLCQQRALVGKI